jgi:hypothetical protein
MASLEKRAFRLIGQISFVIFPTYPRALPLMLGGDILVSQKAANEPDLIVI